jgi:hypothetical protein
MKPRGRPFQKGKSGNPGGRPKTLGDLQSLARGHTKDAITALAEVAKSGPPAARVAAASALLDRGWGKPVQAVEASGPDGAPLHIVLKGVGLDDL